MFGGTVLIIVCLSMTTVRTVLCRDSIDYRSDNGTAYEKQSASDKQTIGDESPSIIMAQTFTRPIQKNTFELSSDERSTKSNTIKPTYRPNYIPICCKPGQYFRGRKCKSNETHPAAPLKLPPIYDSTLAISQMRPDEFVPKYGSPCRNNDDQHPLLEQPHGDDVFYLMENATIFHDYSNLNMENSWYNIDDYCWASVMTTNGSLTVAAVCFGSPIDDESLKKIFIAKPISMIMSLPFLVATFVVYSILKELKSMHGSTLKTYIACLFFAYVGLIVVQLGDKTVSDVEWLCVAIDLPNPLKIKNNSDVACGCVERYCLSMCCPIGSSMIKNNCTFSSNRSIKHFPPFHDHRTLELRSNNISIDDYHVFSWNPCPGYDRYRLEPENNDEDSYKVLDNGSIYLTEIDKMIDFTNYCFGAVNDDPNYTIVMCFDDEDDDVESIVDYESRLLVSLPVGMSLSVPFLVVTFVVYSIIPELRNMHGFTLRGYVGPLIVAYTNLAILQIFSRMHIGDITCITLAFVIHFSFLASFFWLNVMCFDIWWTFGGFRSLQGSMKQRERKKFIIYSIYAWGSASLITGICMIMDFVPSIPRNFIKPEFGVGSCWFRTDAAVAIYFYGPMGITVICNICLFVSTAMKIIQHKKETALHLKGMDSRRHDDNKQWFNLYLKLFIVMGINWSMEIISWLCKDSPQYVWYITDLANALQGVIIFVIFVWKEKIRRLLMKRLGCQNRGFQSRNSTRSAYHSSASRTCTTTAVTAPLHEKVNPYAERTKTTTDESDCV